MCRLHSNTPTILPHTNSEDIQPEPTLLHSYSNMLLHLRGHSNTLTILLPHTNSHTNSPTILLPHTNSHTISPTILLHIPRHRTQTYNPTPTLMSTLHDSIPIIILPHIHTGGMQPKSTLLQSYYTMLRLHVQTLHPHCYNLTPTY